MGPSSVTVTGGACRVGRCEGGEGDCGGEEQGGGEQGGGADCGHSCGSRDVKIGGGMGTWGGRGKDAVGESVLELFLTGITLGESVGCVDGDILLVSYDSYAGDGWWDGFSGGVSAVCG